LKVATDNQEGQTDGRVMTCTPMLIPFPLKTSWPKWSTFWAGRPL